MPIEPGPVQAAALARMQDSSTKQYRGALCDRTGSCFCASGLFAEEGVKAGLLERELCPYQGEVGSVRPMYRAPGSGWSGHHLNDAELAVLGLSLAGYSNMVALNDDDKLPLYVIAAQIRETPDHFFTRPV